MVEEFIKRRFPNDSNWTNGNCYYFALILQTRFPESMIMYDNVNNHFFIRYRGKYYDWTGEILQPPSSYAWEAYEWIDKLHYDRIVRDCLL
jgi:hypothetical protein